MRVHRWTFLLILSPLCAALLLASCGGSGSDSSNGSGPQARSDDIPTATLPSVLPDPLIVVGTPKPAGERYVIQSGDNPSLIAERFGITVEELLSANGITDPTALVAGEELVIPTEEPGGEAPPADTPPPEEATPVPPTEQPAAQQTYIVQEGDIPETIAAQFGITADELMAANGITDPSSLQVGQELIIPTPQPAQ